MDIQIIKEKISTEALRKMAENQYGDMIKAAVDVEREMVALGGELHADANEKLLQDGAHQDAVWGINIYPDKPRGQWIEYISLINVRPRVGNRSMIIGDPALRKKIAEIVNRLIV